MSRNMDSTLRTALKDSFTISGSRTISSVGIEDDTTLIVQFDTPIGEAEVVTVSFDGVVDFLSIDGVDVEAFTNHAVTNNPV